MIVPIILIPFVVAFVTMLFFRSCVVQPHIPRILWVVVPLFATPILGMIMMLLMLVFILTNVDRIKLNEDSDFVKNWIRK